ncbi:MAG: serine/threonine protein kinase [Myxococcales bacterium]|nr:serine/threonine protein kinase [Myxococcales bacterium]
MARPTADTAAAFSTLWDGLGLGATELALSATITPATMAALRSGLPPPPSEAQRAGLTLATLPLLSIALDPNAVTPSLLKGDDITVTGVLGEGGMGRVLSARQRSLGREVAVKTVRDELLDQKSSQALISEGLITGYLEHPNITPVHQLGKDAAGRPLLVMKRITGVVWSDLLADPKHEAWDRLATLPSDRRKAHIEILMQVCNGVSFAHSRGIVHRDIKPDNVMIGEFGEVYLCDWGIALRLTDGESTGHGLVGTPAYLAPEMLDPALPITPATDVYLLGGTLHTLLTRQPRHVGDDMRSVLASAYASEPVVYGDDVPGELADLCNRATAARAADRPQTALDFRRELASYLTHESSMELLVIANERLAELDAGVLALGTAESTEAADEVASVAAECRFAFEQAIRQWHENRAAQAGLERCLALALRVEVERENVSAARSLLGAMREVSAADRAAVDDLAAMLAARVRDAAALATARREADFAVASPIRWRMLAGMLAVGALLAVGAALGRVPPADQVATIGSMVPVTMILAIGGSLSWVFRKQLFVNRANRLLVTILLGEIVLSLVNRASGVIAGEIHGVVMRTDMLLLAGTMFAAGIVFSRTWALYSVFLIVCTGAMQIWPTLTNPLFIGTHMLALIVLAVGWRIRDEKQPVDL